MKKVLCLGQATYEMSLIVDDFPREGSKNRFLNKIGCGGGTASNCAFLLGKWAHPATFAGVIGNDMYGNRIKSEFEDVGLDTRHLESSFTKDTSVSMIIINNKNRTRTMFNVADEFMKLKKVEFDFSPELIFIDGYDYQSSKQVLEMFPKAQSIIGINTVSRETLELCKKCTYIVCSADFAQIVTATNIDYTKPNTLIQVYQKLKEKFENQEIIITLGEKGALYCINNQIKVSPSLKSEIVDPTGAGDIFYGAFTYAIANDWDVEKAVKYGNIASGLSLKTIGARLSIPKLEEVKKIYEQTY